MNVNEPSVFIKMVPTPGIVTVDEGLNIPATPLIVNDVNVSVEPSDPLSFVKTLFVIGVSSVPEILSSTIDGKLFRESLATLVLTFPQT